MKYGKDLISRGASTTRIPAMTAVIFANLRGTVRIKSVCAMAKIAFVRVFEAFRAKKMPSAEDMEFVAKWTGDDDATMGRALGRTVKFYREKAGLTRLQLAKRAGLRLRLILSQPWCAGHRFRD